MMTFSVVVFAAVAMAYFMGHSRISAAIAGISAVGLIGYRTFALGESSRELGTDVLVAIVWGVMAFLLVVMSARSRRSA